jgi:hypothetical protein
MGRNINDPQKAHPAAPLTGFGSLWAHRAGLAKRRLVNIHVNLGLLYIRRILLIGCDAEP